MAAPPPKPVLAAKPRLAMKPISSVRSVKAGRGTGPSFSEAGVREAGQVVGFESINHCFKDVDAQVQNGLRTLQHLSSVVNRVCKAKQDYAKAIGSAIKDFPAGQSGDGMMQHAQALSLLALTFQQSSSSALELASRVVRDLTPLTQDFLKAAEQRRKQVIATEKTVTQTLQKTYDSLRKHRAECHSLLAQILAIQDPESAAGQSRGGGGGSASSGAAGDKLLRGFSRLKDKMMGGGSSSGSGGGGGGGSSGSQYRELGSSSSSPGMISAAGVLADPEQVQQLDRLQAELFGAASQFESMIAEANAAQEHYYSRQLPELLRTLEQIERERLDLCEKWLQELSRLTNKHSEAELQVLQQLQAAVSSMDIQHDILGFVENLLTLHGPGSDPLPLEYDLACRPEHIRRGQFSADNINSFFGKTLDEVMELQRQELESGRLEERHAGLDVPVLLNVLVESIRSQGGLDREGIFRHSARQDDVDALRKQLDDYNFKALVSPDGASNPDLPASTLKAWLRSLQTPLFPTELYDACLAVGRKADAMEYTNEEVLRLYEQCPPLNKRVILVLIDLFQEISSPEHLENTRMSLRNLSIIFAPSFLKRVELPNLGFVQDSSRMLNEAKHQGGFVHMLLRSLCGRSPIWQDSEQGASVPAIPVQSAGQLSVVQPEEVAAPADPSVSPPPTALAQQQPSPAKESAEQKEDPVEDREAAAVGSQADHKAASGVSSSSSPPAALEHPEPLSAVASEVGGGDDDVEFIYLEDGEEFDYGEDVEVVEVFEGEEAHAAASPRPQLSSANRRPLPPMPKR